MSNPQPFETTSNPQAVEAPFISEPLTWEQICERYPDQWVCLVEMDKINDTDFDFRTARVVGHGKTRRDPLDQARPLCEQYELIGHYFTRLH
ncbi:MAG TPA: hypothetical protein VHW23_48335 [Kofleriaceae bacterium]|jgi:hypothetical protein|nr:hypothetical protein [Kofleriaceae bacterium]